MSTSRDGSSRVVAKVLMFVGIAVVCGKIASALLGTGSPLYAGAPKTAQTYGMVLTYVMPALVVVGVIVWVAMSTSGR